MKTIRIKLLAAVFICSSFSLFAQRDTNGIVQNRPNWRIEPFASFQLWSVYSMNHQVFDASKKTYEKVDDRLNFIFRRARLGFRMQPYERLRFNLIFAYDGAGKDLLTSSLGQSNNGANPSFGLFDGFMDWRIKPKKESIFLTAGFFRPQVSRESITAAWAVASMEKSQTQNYLRQHIVGVGPGRVMGTNLGGLLFNASKKLAFNYNLGLFNPAYFSNNGQSVGQKFSPLIAYRAVLSIGDPEMNQYAINYLMNFYGRRKGISLALDGTWQGQTDFFKSNTSLGADVLLNYGILNFDAEYHQMARSGQTGNQDLAQKSWVGHLRGGLTFKLPKNGYLEPALMVQRFQGAMSSAEQVQATQLRMSAGTDTNYDLGLNWHLQERRLKLLLHYTWRQGDLGAAAEGATINEFFNQPGLGAIRRGNWLGLGLNAIF
jgi:Phosphate-selective porin O and P